MASRQTGTATAILRALLQAAGKDIRLKVDGVSISIPNYLHFSNKKSPSSFKCILLLSVCCIHKVPVFFAMFQNMLFAVT